MPHSLTPNQKRELRYVTTDEIELLRFFKAVDSETRAEEIELIDCFRLIDDETKGVIAHIIASSIGRPIHSVGRPDPDDISETSPNVLRFPSKVA